MLKQITKLIDVKSLVTLAMTGAFIGMALTGEVDSDAFTNIFLMIMGFYFGTQSAKVNIQQ